MVASDFGSERIERAVPEGPSSLIRAAVAPASWNSLI